MAPVSETACGTCLRLRMFLTIAGALIAGLYLQPGWATAVAGLMPAPLLIGWAICGFGTLGFVLRLRHHLRHQR
ncbi:hypothetical protein [Roseovarius sp. MS2]|uniref:hypothetical protein n=1 Tax=Roseovarius sp. MS2 TaxID=3390728 RepID=UPI003F5C18EF